MAFTFKFIVIGFLLAFFMTGLNSSTSDKYDHLVYAQQWPQSVCNCVNGWNRKEKCRIPDGVKTWTIHGLWPTLGDSDKPDYCNNSWHFKVEQIKDIESKMRICWPPLLHSSNSDSFVYFWKHIWAKHGTCGTNLPSLDSEHKYFATGLELNQKYNLPSMLADAGIVPSKTKSYQISDIHEAIKGRLGHKPYLHCCKANGRQQVQDVMVCLNKQLIPIDCVEDDKNCAKHLPIYYEPITQSIYV